MDALKAEISLKRKAIETGPLRAEKYMRRGDIERLKQEQQPESTTAKITTQKAELRVKSPAATTPRSETHSPLPEAYPTSDSPKPEGTQFNISNEETVRRLRAKGEPARLFGESDKDRRLRLRALELLEEKNHDRKSGQNDFKKALEDVENEQRGTKERDSQRKKKEENSETQRNTILDLALVKTDPDKLYPLIYYALKGTLKDWEEWMNNRPEEIKRTTQGKLAAATQMQSADYLKPLFKSLRSRNLPPDVLARMAEIVHYMQKREYQKANDAYLRLSIGNAPWPIGVTMVGIHERSAREKISTDQVAHVLNDEVSRKYIQSLKRLLTFSQTKYPPEDVSQLMG